MDRKCGALKTQKYVNQFSMIFAEELQVYRITARYPHVCYQMIYRLHNNGWHTWATGIALLLTKYGFQYVLAQQGVGNKDVFLKCYVHD